MNRRRSIPRGARPSPWRCSSSLAPSWGGTNLGQALIDAVAAIEDVADTSEKAGRMPRRVVLISDLAAGEPAGRARRLRMALRRQARLEDSRRRRFQRGSAALADSVRGRAGARPARASRPGLQRPDPRGRRSSSCSGSTKRERARASRSTFTSRRGEPRGAGAAADAILRPTGRSGSKGDAYGFDNTLYFADERREECDRPLRRRRPGRRSRPAFSITWSASSSTRPAEACASFLSSPAAALAWEPDHPPPLVVLTAETTAENIRRLQAIRARRRNSAVRGHGARASRARSPPSPACRPGTSRKRPPGAT